MDISQKNRLINNLQRGQLFYLDKRPGRILKFMRVNTYIRSKPTHFSCEGVFDNQNYIISIEDLRANATFIKEDSKEHRAMTILYGTNENQPK